MKNNKTSYSKINEVRVGFYFDYMTVADIDPANIKTFEPAQVLNNIYSRLVEYDQNGNIQPGLCSSFYFEGDYLVFEFDKKVQTVTGHYIDAEDAATSLRRLLKLKTGTHSSIELILNLKHIENDIFQNWNEVFTKNNKLFVLAPNISIRPYLITSFSTGDLAIIPKSAIDIHSLQIKNHKETSGPYFLEKITKSDKLEEWVLRNNPKHYNLLDSSPLVVRLIDKKIPSAYKLLVDNEIDIIPSSIFLDKKNLEEIKDIEQLNITKTLNIKLTYAQYSKEAVKKFTREERNNIVKKFIKMYDHIPERYEVQETSTFFQDQAFGQISEKENEEIRNLNEKRSSLSSESKVKFKYFIYFQNKFSKYIQQEIPELDLVKIDNTNYNDIKTDLTITDADTAFEESLPLIHYNFKIGVFGSDIDYEKWITEYMALESNDLKSAKIHDLHLNALKEGVIFPMFKSPYTSVGRNGYVLPLSPIFASSHFWKIKKVN